MPKYCCDCVYYPMMGVLKIKCGECFYDKKHFESKYLSSSEKTTMRLLFVLISCGLLYWLLKGLR